MLDLSIKIIRVILLCISCYGWCAYLVNEKKIKVEFALSILISGIGSIVFFAGILNILAEASYTIWFLGIFLAICSLIKHKNIFKLLSPGIIVFLIALVVLMALLYGSKFTSYDNFSHWAVVSRLILQNDRFPTMHDDIIMFQSYPTGSASFIYYICKTTGIHAEWMMMYAQATAIIASIIPLFTFARKKTGVIMGAVTIVLVLCANVRITDIYVDTLLSAVGAAGLLFCIYYKERIYGYYWAIIPNLIFLVSIKNSGIMFVIIIIAYIVIFTKGKRWKSVPILTSCSMLTLLIWQKHVKSVFAEGMSAKHSLSIEYFESVFGDKGKNEILEILHNFWGRVFNIRNEFIIFLILAVGLVFIAKLTKISNFRDIRKKVIFYVSIYIVYQNSLLGMYMFSMPTEEAITVAAYDRYHITMISFLVIVIMADFIQIHWANKRMAIGFLISALALETIAMSPDFSKLTRMNWRESERYKCEAVVEKYNVPQDASYMFLMDDDDDGYTYFFYRYYFATSQVAVFYEGQHPYIGDQWKNYEYLIVVDDTEKNRDYINDVLNIDSHENFIVLDEWKNR